MTAKIAKKQREGGVQEEQEREDFTGRMMEMLRSLSFDDEAAIRAWLEQCDDWYGFGMEARMEVWKGSLSVKVV